MAQTKILLKSNKKGVSLDKYAGKWVAFVDEKVWPEVTLSMKWQIK